MIHITDTSYQFQNSLIVKFKSSQFTHVAFLRSEALKDVYGDSMKACAKEMPKPNGLHVDVKF